MIAIIANQQKYDCLQLLKKIEALLAQFKTSFQVIQNYPFSPEDISVIRSAKKWIILGGDGTILSTFTHFTTPPQGSVIAVNFGTLGYMAGIAERDALALIENYLLWEEHPSGDTRTSLPEKSPLPTKLFKEENRYILFTESQFQSKTVPTKSYFALNETTVRATQTLSPIHIHVKINGQSIAKIRGDGIIIATPTGSTAYNLSAGGPILSPEIEALVLTFISPHSLTIKPIVVAREDMIELIVLNDALLSLDGTIKEEITPKQSIRCRLGAVPLTFIQPKKHTAYQSLKQKLHWGG